MTLLCNLTAKSISKDLWTVLEMLYQVFEKEGFDYFTDMMPVLHNYITVDTNAFLSNENHILAMFNMVKVVSFSYLLFIIIAILSFTRSYLVSYLVNEIRENIFIYSKFKEGNAMLN